MTSPGSHWPGLGATLLFAQETHAGGLPDTFWPGFVGTLVFGLTGLLLSVLGFKIFDWISPGIDVQKELAEKQNIAVAIVAAAIILGICYIVATVVQ